MVGAAWREHSRRVSGVRAVSSYLPQLTRKAFQRHGFSSAALLTDWAGIVGADVASYTSPERLKWPHRREGAGGAEEHERGGSGATLVIRVDGPRAIELQHKARQLIDRINATFGYRAIGELRFVQAPIISTPVSWRAPAPRAPITAEHAPSPDLATISDDALRQALTRLEANVHGRRGLTPQA